MYINVHTCAAEGGGFTSSLLILPLLSIKNHVLKKELLIIKERKLQRHK